MEHKKSIEVIMKNILLFILLFAGFTVAQENAKLINVETGGYVLTDSLGYTNLDETSDSVIVLNMNFTKSKIRIFVTGNANTTLDSIHVRQGSYIYNTSGTVVGTTYGSWASLSDSAGTATNIIINNTVGKDYTLKSSVVQLLQFVLMNHRPTLVTRNVQITIQAIK